MTHVGDSDFWTIKYIKNFIGVSTGAAILGDILKFKILSNSEDGKIEDVKKVKTVQFPSYFPVVKMDLILLVVLALIIVSCSSLLMVWNIKFHKGTAIPILRRATLDKIIKSSHTEDVLGPAVIDKLDVMKPSNLGKLRLKFKKGDNGLWGLYNAKGQSFLARGAA